MRVFLGLGSNQGNRRAHLRAAIAAMRGWPQTSVRRVSGLYESAYVGPGRQARYLNACVELDSALEPLCLLDLAQGLERAAGRPPRSHLRPRNLDVDILACERSRVASDRLVIPHPRIAERRFVLEPLAELDAELLLPGWETTPRELLRRDAVQRQAVVRLADSDWWSEEAA
jgi:2-amino-4-hydroxy-6-hydroxymethyldihydropteridine diphosphokinase